MHALRRNTLSRSTSLKEQVSARNKLVCERMVCADETAPRTGEGGETKLLSGLYGATTVAFGL